MSLNGNFVFFFATLPTQPNECFRGSSKKQSWVGITCKWLTTEFRMFNQICNINSLVYFLNLHIYFYYNYLAFCKLPCQNTRKDLNSVNVLIYQIKNLTLIFPFSDFSAVAGFKKYNILLVQCFYFCNWHENLRICLFCSLPLFNQAYNLPPHNHDHVIVLPLQIILCLCSIT